jgi:hypothetical protein
VRFDRESWRKLYVLESSQHRLLSLSARSFRDFLLRFAEEDGTLLHDSTDIARDLCRVIGADSSDKKQVAADIKELVAVGYLTVEGKRLWITKFLEAQEARSPAALRQAKYEAKRAAEKAAKEAAEKAAADKEASVRESVSSGVRESVRTDAQSDVSPDVIRDETRRDETTTPNPPAAAAVVRSLVPTTEAAALDMPIRERAELGLKRPDVADFCCAHRWPEVVEAARVMADGMGLRQPKLAPGGKDKAVVAMLTLFAAGYSLDEFREASELARKSEFMRGLKGLDAVSPTVMSRLFESSSVGVAAESVVTP